MEESAEETSGVEAAMSPPSVGSPPRTRVRQEAAQGEEEGAEEAERSAVEKAGSCFPLAKIPSCLRPAARRSRTELLAAACRAKESAEVSRHILAVLFPM